MTTGIDPVQDAQATTGPATADRLVRTVLAMPADDDRARSAQWRRLIDIVAEHGDGMSPEVGAAALRALALLRPAVSGDQRAEAARSVAGRTRFAPLIAMFARDEASVAGEALAMATLDPAGWAAVLPSTTPLAREVLRRRRDLPTAVLAQLRAFGPGDAVLGAPSTASAAQPQPAAEGQIRALVERIASFRAGQAASRPRGGPPKPDFELKAPLDDGDGHGAFLFEVGPDGQVDWAEPAVRGAIIGLSLLEPGEPGGPGTDASAVGAYRRRTDIVNARLLLGGTGPYAGAWRFNAIPWFDGDSGQFQGYRARARRPRREECAHGMDRAPVGADQAAGTLALEPMRELIHELRSPLNAITGFAQMIEGQMLGAVADCYRQLAGTIVADAAIVDRILTDVALLLEKREPARQPDTAGLDLGALVRRILSDCEPLITQRGVVVAFDAGGVDRVQGDPLVTHRMIDRLLSSIISAAGRDERIQITLHGEADEGGAARLDVMAPDGLAAMPGGLSCQPGHDALGHAPTAEALALGFSLRLVGNLAAGQSGALTVNADGVILRLPSLARRLETVAPGGAGAETLATFFPKR